MDMSERVIKNVLSEPKRYPEPEYPYCNKGHRLQEVYNERRHSYEWDCPICKARMEALRRSKR